MNKLFLILSGVTLGGTTPLITNLVNVANQTNTTNNTPISATLAMPKEVNTRNVSVNSGNADIIIRTDPINLTALGINRNSVLNEYSVVELSGFTVNFWEDALITTEGYKWGAKMSEGEGDWHLILKESATKNRQGYLTPFTCKIERKHSLWYDAHGDYNLALIYRLNGIARSTGGSNYPVEVAAETGSIVKFY